MKAFDKERRSRATDGRMTEFRIAWVRVISGLWVLQEYPPHSESVKGSEVKVRFPRKGNNIEMYPLTALTEPELVALGQLWALAIEISLPVVRERDRVAKEAAAEGDDTYARSYRALPENIWRPRAKYLQELAQKGEFAPLKEDPEDEDRSTLTTEGNDNADTEPDAS